MTQMQTYALYALAGTGVFLLVLWLVVRARSRRRAEVREEIERKVAAEAKIAQDRAVKDHMEHIFGRRALYTREMAQRELDRYHGLRVKGPDPTFEEWCRAKGLPVDDFDEEVPTG
jgi:flagellar biosynthesis/type III secretory pathway M-ring protein FliF/YscJ